MLVMYFCLHICVTLDLSLQPIDEINNCGPNLKYEVLYRSIGASDWMNVTTAANMTNLVIDNAAYEVRIYAENDEGRNRDFRTVHVPDNSSQGGPS